jgi:hypothetical protein
MRSTCKLVFESRDNQMKSLKSAAKEQKEQHAASVDELVHELNADGKRKLLDTAKDVRVLKKRLSNIETTSTKRLEREKILKADHNKLKDYCMDQQSTIEALESHLSDLEAQLNTQTNLSSLVKKERPVGRRGGSDSWPPKVVQLICELLVNGTPPSAIPATIASISAMQNGTVPDNLPSLSFIRQCRVVVQTIAELLAAFRLGNAETWLQIFTDGTSRRQIAFQNLIISILENDKIVPIILSSCIYLEDETSETQVQAILKKVCQILWKSIFII